MNTHKKNIRSVRKLANKVREHDSKYNHSAPPPVMSRFIDLFCGIGGFRIAFERAGCECVFSCDWNKPAQQTYAANFGEMPIGDIYAVPSAAIPDHDILCAGFPCQPFSIAGVSKKNALGEAHGFAEKKQGNLFFELARIIRDKRPKAFLLENVKNLCHHDKGRTYEIIMSTLKDELGYHVCDWKKPARQTYIIQRLANFAVTGPV